jgi:hypothetical protein
MGKFASAAREFAAVAGRVRPSDRQAGAIPMRGVDCLPWWEGKIWWCVRRPLRVHAIIFDNDRL